MSAKNKELVRRFYEEIDKGNLAAMDELVAENYLDHSPPPFPGIRPGREGLKQSFKLFWEATPGYHKIEDQIAEGDKVVTRLVAYGTHERDLPGIPRTGNKMEMTATVIHRIATASSWKNGQTKTSRDASTARGDPQVQGVILNPSPAAR
jgi:ketosteroid isomerase-like protein